MCVAAGGEGNELNLERRPLAAGDRPHRTGQADRTGHTHSSGPQRPPQHAQLIALGR